MTQLKLSPYSAFVVEDGSKPKVGDTIVIRFKDERITVTFGKDGLWRSDDGCVYGFQDPDSTTDQVVRCGIDPLALPEDSPYNDACRGHDYAYSCPAYQINHTREEADDILKTHVELIGRDTWFGYMALPFYWVVRLFGGKYWENKDTND